MLKRSSPSKEIARAIYSALKPFHKEGERRIKNAARYQRQQQQEKPKQEETSLKDATFAVMEEAVAHASGNGRLPVGSRRLFYRARDLIQKHTSKRFHPITGYKYFKELLVEYQEVHGPISGLYYDPRGRLHEPHTERTVDLGTLEVAAYDFPHLVFNKILYVEKEGHWPLLKQAQIAERYDMAIVMGKGYPTEAARTLFENAERGKDYQLFVVHDADPHGYNIARVMREETRRMPDYNVNVIDLGLTVADALAMGLEPEDFTRQNELPTELFASLNELEKEYFIGEQKGRRSWLCKRIELDAMTAPQEVEYIERKLKENGVRGKVIPPEGELPELAEEMYRKNLAQWANEALERMLSFDEIKEALADEFVDWFKLENARRYIEEGFEEDETLSWRSALEDRLDVIREEHGDALKEFLGGRITEAIKKR